MTTAMHGSAPGAPAGDRAAATPAAGTEPSTSGVASRLLDGRYRLLDRLGSGGAADVWRAHDTRLERTVAIKIFRPGATDAARERAEAEFMARCSHAGLVTVFDAGVVESQYEAPRSYLVMEVVEGSTLRDRLAAGPLPVAAVASIGAQVGGALAYVHAQGVVHRDVKPANLLVADGPAERPVVKLADFGVARMLGGEPLTEVGTTVGTANYVSPEQIRGAQVEPPSDIYSLGLVLIEALTGRMVYPGRGVEAAIARLDRRPIVPTSAGPVLAGLLTAMTDDNPAARPSAAEAAAQLTAIATAPGNATASLGAVASEQTSVLPVAVAAAGWSTAGVGGWSGPAQATSTETGSITHPPGKRPRRGLLLAGLAAAAALVGGVGLAVGSSHGAPAPHRDPAAPAVISPSAHSPVAGAPSSSAVSVAAAPPSRAGASSPSTTQLAATTHARTARVTGARVHPAPAAAQHRPPGVAKPGGPGHPGPKRKGGAHKPGTEKPGAPKPGAPKPGALKPRALKTDAPKP